MIYNRQSGEYYEEKQYGGKVLKFLYSNAFGRMLLKIAVSPSFSKLAGAYYSSSLSRRKIKPFIKKHNIDITDYEKAEYKSFNDFFTRRKTASSEFKQNDFISPADSKLSVYRIDENLSISVKNSVYSVDELLGKTGGGSNLSGGYCFVFRLSMDDCHRYCFVDSGRVKEKYLIKGKLNTVSYISEKRKVFSENTRQISFLQTDNFGDMIVVEVGAMLVGKFHESEKTVFSKGEEKGYFELGGSTIIILTDSKISVDEDILEKILNVFEIKVNCKERIGEKKC
ncbi:MAG: phosphatidylserine decarboxylase, partial [Clostridia bacterium]|nr:phosphatidylserine decarboxylase [Clostridia bacterium]